MIKKRKKKIKKFAIMRSKKYQQNLKNIASAVRGKVTCLINDDYNYKKIGYKPCDAPFSSKDWYYAIRRDQGTKTVALYIEGGPFLGYTPKINPWMASTLVKHELLFMRSMYHMKKPLALHYKVSRVEAEKELEEYYDILEKIILEQQALGKKVILLGHSFGSFIVNKFLQIKGTIADLTITVGTRIAYGEKNGKQIQKLSSRLDSPFGFFKPSLNRFDWNNKLYPHVSGIKFTIGTLLGLHDLNFLASFISAAAPYSIDEWNPKILDKDKLIFVSSVVDNIVGGFSQGEKDFANKHGRYIEYSKKDVEKSYKEWFFSTSYGLESAKKPPPEISAEKDWLLAGHYSGVTPGLSNRWANIADEMLKN